MCLGPGRRTGHRQSTLWKWAVAAARERSFQVLSSRPAGPETKLAFAGLGDLFARIPDGVLLELPEPQREALEVALLRATVKHRPPDQRAVSAAVLGALRVLAKTSPLVVAVEDVQWLDASSARVLEYALRRLDAEPIGFLELPGPREFRDRTTLGRPIHTGGAAAPRPPSHFTRRTTPQAEHPGRRIAERALPSPQTRHATGFRYRWHRYAAATPIDRRSPRPPTPVPPATSTCRGQLR